jgi:hypothetical protein
VFFSDREFCFEELGKGFSEELEIAGCERYLAIFVQQLNVLQFIEAKELVVFSKHHKSLHQKLLLRQRPTVPQITQCPMHFIHFILRLIYLLLNFQPVILAVHQHINCIIILREVRNRRVFLKLLGLPGLFF